MINKSQFESNIFLQQQLLLQQMILYNQILLQRTNSLSNTQQQPLKHKNSDENDLSSQLIQKLDETNLVKPVPSKSSKKQTKSSKAKDFHNIATVSKPKSDTPLKKKIFLSMTDIKEAQYKKFKIIGENKQNMPVSVVHEQL